MHWVTLEVKEVTRWRNVVGKTADWCRMACHVVLLPLANEANEEVSSELAVEHLGKEVKVGNEGSLENDWDVRCVEKLHWERSRVASNTSRFEGKFNTESL